MDHNGSPADPGSGPEEYRAPDSFEVRVTGTDRELVEVLQRFRLDIGCRHPHIERNTDGRATLLVYATEEQFEELRAAGCTVVKGLNVSALARERRVEIVTEDPFDGGRKAPRGLGIKTACRPEPGRS